MILSAPGTNCDDETAFAFEQAGATPYRFDIAELIRRDRCLDNCQIMVIPGGFTYGDDISAGKVLANELSLKLGVEIPEFLGRGGLILGICNGFQVLVKAGILPGLKDQGPLSLTLSANDSGRFECRWIHLEVNKESPCLFTRSIESMYLPVACGEGKVVTLDKPLPASVVVLFYADQAGNRDAAYPDNPTGSENNIAGICDESGHVFALMPHPERHLLAIQHPQWTRLSEPGHYGDGFRIFKNAVDWARSL
jgi:phosphoribosylformylglycinamidine synthase